MPSVSVIYTSLTTGAVVSATVITWIQGSEGFSQISYAIHVRVIVWSQPVPYTGQNVWQDIIQSTIIPILP